MKGIPHYICKLLSQKLFLILCAVIAFLISSCNPARRVAKGQYLLSGNAFRYRSQAKKSKNVIAASESKLVTQLIVPTAIAPEQLLAYVRQKPNTKILRLIPLHLMIYNLYDSATTEQRKSLRNQRIDKKYKAKNEKRIAEGKEPIKESVIKAKKERRTFREWVLSSGEHPVIFDSLQMKSSLRQLRLFLANKGYFNCKVKDSVSLKNKKAKIFYIIEPGKPYKIDSVKYSFEDPSIASEVYSDSSNCLINSGDNFDYDIFQKERDRITRKFNDDGYYAFVKEYIHYDLDSVSQGNHKIAVKIDIKKFLRPVRSAVNPDSTVQVQHPTYHIRNVTIQMQYNPNVAGYSPTDTLKAGDYTIVYPERKLSFKPGKLLNKVFIRKGDLYRVSNVDHTYTGISQLKAFRYINIKIVPVSPDSNLLDCYIQLMPVTKQSIGIEGEGNTTGGDYGIQGDLIYENKNCFKGAEDIQFKVKGGLEAQKLLSNTSSSNTTIGKIIPLNTIDIGPELDFVVPRPLFPFNLGANIDSTHIFKHSKFGLGPNANPQSVFKIIYDYQDRPLYYVRHISGLAYTFNYYPYDRKKQNRYHLEIKLPEFNYVHATLFSGFQTTLNNTHNFFLLNSFTNHFIPDIAFSLIYNSQILAKPKDFNFWKFDIEESGLILKTLIPNDSILGVPLSLYLKGAIEYRHYFVVSKDDKLVIRALLGAGKPLGNTQELPFDKSFWAGGSDDIRAWQARSLGPGGYAESAIVDQIGDIKMEFNQEYRFNVISILNLAFFFDEGNVWLLNNNPAIPNGDFLLSGPHSFYNQIAWGTGIGLRFDFTYFVFRLDFGAPLHDPALTSPNLFNVKSPLERSGVQFGIGYPF